MTHSEIVSAFCAAWGEGDFDHILGAFADDAVYTNIPIDPPNEGIEAIRKTIEAFRSMAEKIEFVIQEQVEGPSGIVMNERVDRFLMNGRWVELKVMGAFELRDGKISAWRDYFDMGQFQAAMAGG